MTTQDANAGSTDLIKIMRSLGILLELNHIGAWDLDVVDQTANRTLEHDRIFGYQSLLPVWTYEMFLKHVLPEDRLAVDTLFQTAMAEQTEWQFECRIRRTDGVMRWIFASGSPQFDDTGTVRRLAGIVQDISERKQAEQRQLELLNKLTSINEELNNFTFVASHDLKSPLRGIHQLATWIAEDLGDNVSSETQKHLGLMRNRITRMEMLLDDLLNYARLGQAGIKIESVNTSELVRNIVDLIATNKEVFLPAAEDLPILETQKASLDLVLRNLISNAIKHHHKAQCTITITAQPIVDGFEFSVMDDGPGILPEHQERVFAMFQTIKTRDQVEGSGMGLALVRKTVELMGGAVRLESNGICGSKFSFTWPTKNHVEEPL